MPETTDSFAARQQKRRRQANLDTAAAVLWQALLGAVLLGCRVWVFVDSGAGQAVMLVLALVDLAMIVPILLVRKQRMKEIAGGEEDEARQY